MENIFNPNIYVSYIFRNVATIAADTYKAIVFSIDITKVVRTRNRLIVFQF